ncbi:PREDICTED: uncharacterized protein LOC105449960 [Wasmannia auropunctata]|uniref:uncharacterized protein LOC105449960 n=1 Tax=Wasmannia auropunctata TaxID=64793 RepID=UPI0005F00C74|nr:PREDICTED: uncharacterized protein LOC105449960 [Wasmannia auropunctata]
MSVTLEDLMVLQNQTMNSVSRALSNFKKLGQAKMTRAVTRQRLATLKENFAKCRTLDGQITRLSDEKLRATHSYFTGACFETCEDCYNEAADFMVEVLASYETDPTPTITVSDPHDFSRPSPHLPKLNLPTFDGSIDKWETFRDRFQSMIQNDPNLSNVNRMHYLFSCLKGAASKALDHLAITNANFEVAWNILVSRYDNKRRLVTTHLISLLDLPTVTSETSKDLCNLRDQANTAIQALTNLGRAVRHWDDFLVLLVARKLDKTSRKAWELKLGDTLEYPSYHELDQFLETRIRALDAITPTSLKDTLPELSKRKAIASHNAAAVPFSCSLCKSNHLLYQCSMFLKKTPSQRFDFIKSQKRCINCFSIKHSVKDCTSSRACRQCSKRHHTLLHLDNSIDSAKTSESEPASASTSVTADTEVASHLMSRTVAPNSKILLATARVRVYSPLGRFVTVRALIDQGSVSTLMTESLAQSLRLPKVKRAVCITGIGETQSIVRSAAQITITPVSREGPAYSTTALILRSLTKYIPSRMNTACTWKHVAGLKLADSEPMSSDPIDLIIGADLFGLLVLDGVRKGSEREPTAQNTTLGWILSGPITAPSVSDSTFVHAHHGVVLEGLDFDLRRFWETEELPQKVHRSPEEDRCEEHFVATHTRSSNGRYIVRLPFKNGPPISLGESRFTALSSLYRMEQRLRREPANATEYRDFLSEYENLGHMTKIPSTDSIESPFRYYIPHHAILRDSSATTRLRVVFNASCRTTNGTSLNDHMMIGPKLQKDLATIIMQWRQHRYVYTADIAKMYRQIRVDSRDTNYQRILWRPSTSEPVNDYRLETVTYGTAAAPYLALRVLEQLANDDGAHFPLAVPVLRHHTYVDDCAFGADDKILARQTRDQLIQLLNKGCFRLRKWASNSEELLSDIDPADHGLATNKVLQGDKHLKVLGIIWNPTHDIFQFRVSIPSSPGRTKRAILSLIAKFFDPLGWATPVIITAKIFLQCLWSLKCSWDDEIPSQHYDNWLKYYNRLSCLDAIRIPRWVAYGSHTIHSALHGFSDASTSAFAAAVYLRTVQIDGSITVSLLIAKSKVAPLKTMSIPRLELSAAHLLARLMHFSRLALQLPTIECHCWTDSTVTLAWLNQSPSRWKTFVANRVSAIHSLLPDVPWRHVPTQTNPADCASRGLAPDALEKHNLWWSGPLWLRQPPDGWPNANPSVSPDAPLEERPQPSVPVFHSAPNWDLASRFSSWPKLLRVTAYLYRFLSRQKRSDSFSSASLQPDEIDKAKFYWLRSIQADMFPLELAALSRQSPLPKSSSLSSLNPYLDSDGLLRVGGRLRHARLPGATKNPIVVRSHPLLSLIIEHHHMRTLHAGPQLTLASLRSEFWLLRSRATVRSVLYKCIKCTRERAEVPVELMGDLPDVRVNRTSRAFVHTGVDYAGPIVVRTAPGRGHKSQKAYIALFVCLTTKAIHLELVTDYSSITFIAVYQRFVSRRGLPQSMYSDNGTTFKGADRELSQAHAKAIRDPNFLNCLATDKTAWHFLPPAAPHFGGLWEAGVRSMKHHLKRCIGLYTLTLEEMTTLLCRVEACLNSRPLAAISDSLDDYRALTPGHFLTGSPLIAIPEPSVLDLNENRLSRWQTIQRLTEIFWRSWSSDYLQTLQQRPKWRVVVRLAKVGQIVLVRNPLTPPSHWELGRITACHPGDDGLTRVVTVQTSRSEYRRPIAKLCFLPVDINTEEAKGSVTAGGVST